MLIDEILNRLREYLKTEIDADVARALSVKPQSIINWPKRGTIPWPELFTFSQEHKLSFDWILTGKEQNNFMCGWPEDTIRACNDLKEILDFGEKREREIILSTIEQAKKIRDLKKPVAGVSSERRKKSTGKKKVM